MNVCFQGVLGKQGKAGFPGLKGDQGPAGQVSDIPISHANSLHVLNIFIMTLVGGICFSKHSEI